MSIKHVQFALDGVPNLNAGQRLTLVSLGEWANDDGVCWPSHDTIAKRVGVGRRQVIRIIDQLESMGAIERIERKQYSNKYRVRCDIAMSHPKSSPDVTPTAHVTSKADVTLGTPDVTSTTADVTSRASRCDIAMSPEPPIEPLTEPPVEPPVGADAPKPLPDNGPIQKIVKAWYERVGVEPANYAKALGFAKQLHAARVTPRELSEMYDWFVADSWRLEKGFDLGTCVVELEKFRVAKRTPKPPSNGRASPVKETTLERNLRNLHAAFDDPEPEYDNVFDTKGFVRQ